MIFYFSAGTYACGVSITMDDGEQLKAGLCATDTSFAEDKKEFAFNNNSNLFLSVGGIPSSGWQVISVNGIKSFDSYGIESFKADFDLGTAGPYDLWISPLDKRTGDQGVIKYPRFI